MHIYAYLWPHLIILKNKKHKKKNKKIVMHTLPERCVQTREIERQRERSYLLFVFLFLLFVLTFCT